MIVTLAEIKEAQKRLEGVISPSPLIHSGVFSKRDDKKLGFPVLISPEYCPADNQLLDLIGAFVYLRNLTVTVDLFHFVSGTIM